MNTRRRTTVYTITALAVLSGVLLTPDGRSAAYAQLGIPPVQDRLGRPLDRGLDRVDRLGSRAQRKVDEAEDEIAELEEPSTGIAEVVDAEEVDAGKVDEHPGTAVDAAASTVQGTAGAALDAASSTAGQATQAVTVAAENLLPQFVPATDASGWPVEKGVTVMLLDQQQTAAVMQSGIDVASRRDLRALGLTMLTVRDANTPASLNVGDLRLRYPDAAVDFNHVYRFASDLEPDLEPPSADANAAAADGLTETGSAWLRVGMIDSAVLGEHPALSESRVVSQDFVAHEGDKPLGHGTAVASLIARSAANEAEIHAASVFFQAPGHAPGATTESLVAALDWLVSQRVDVINMSLAGPANTLLEEALAHMADAKPWVIAAVGNNGPSGEPLYPAAYAGVIAVTAVDREQKIFRYANRGEHVDFAALGVNVKVADSGGSWRMESGTSMASPHVAVVVARAFQSLDMPANALVDVLADNAEDLGKKGFDRIFGYGHISEAPVLVSSH